MTPNPAADSPLNAAQMKMLREAVVRSGKVKRAAGVASFNIWSSAIIAALAFPWGLVNFATGSILDGVINMVIGAVLGFVAWNESVGRTMILALQPAGARRLALNQLFFMAFIIAYCLYSIATLILGPNPLKEQMAQNPDIEKMLGPIGDLYLYVGVAIYVAIIPITVAFQGGCAWYYHTRAAAIRQHLEQTPAWVTQVQRALAG